jgi:F-type H+-transporting ATPase subunit a
MPKISIKPEPLFEIFGFIITNSYFTSWIVIILFIILAVHYRQQASKKDKSKLYYLVNFIVKSIYDLFKSILGEDKNAIFFPLLGAFFFYILLQNWFGLLPGVGSLLIKVKEHGEDVLIPLLRGDNADLNTTLALGLISVGLIQYFGIKYLGLKEYLRKYFNFKGPIDFFIGILDILSEISRVLSFAFRLFGNIFAGEVLLIIVAFLVPVLASFPFLVLEIFVGFVQALVFSMLTGVFISVAIEKHH